MSAIADEREAERDRCAAIALRLKIEWREKMQAATCPEDVSVWGHYAFAAATIEDAIRKEKP